MASPTTETIPAPTIQKTEETPTTTPLITTTDESSAKIEGLGFIVEELKTATGDSKEQLEKILEQRDGNLLYQDSNKDGISDYDSIYIYNIDPTKPSLTSKYEGKSITASEKILLGFDPTKPEIVKVTKEEPAKSSAPVVTSYKVKEIALTDKKEVVLKGQALPNSFITIYIYSTPIIVTVKTNERGEWQYTLDKELEDGDHTIYTATVNNSGNIVAKSSPYLFTKTAEAVTLKEIPLEEASLNVTKPSLLKGNDIYIVIAMIILLVATLLTLIGLMSGRKNEEKVQ
jgi:hypothetical protein